MKETGARILCHLVDMSDFSIAGKWFHYNLQIIIECLAKMFLVAGNNKTLFLGILYCHCSPPYLSDFQTT